MSLNYEKIKTKQEQGSHQWTSYSDLFLVLSVTFLLLFVVANLRTGTSSMVASQQLDQAKNEVADLKKQIKAYEILKDNYAEKGATQDEIETYRELMDKMSLLETEAKKEHEKLSEEARKAKEKMQGLNRYQSMVKNIINANMVAASKLKQRSDVIEEQGKELVTLDRQMAAKHREIENNNQLIAKVERELEQKQQNLKQAARSSAKARKKYEEEMAKLEEESTERIQKLKKANQKFMSELDETKTRLDEKNREAEKLVETLSAKEMEFRNSIAGLQQEQQQRMAAEKEAFEKGLKNAQLTAEAKIAKEREYRASVEAQAKEYAERMGRLNSELAGTRKKLRDAGEKYQGSIQSLQRSNDALQKDLQASLKKLNQQRKLAEKIKGNFGRAGVNAKVDAKTGDVTIEFSPDYFDTDKANLKPNMKKTLDQTIPVYAKSLLEDPEIARRISNIEIVGFASPTYQGKVVDPKSLAPEDRLAVNYNMDLSYKRAKTIFEYVFNPDKMQFQYQKELLSLVKVTGRSYLTTESTSQAGQGRNPATGKSGDYCSVNDCKKSQIVSIKFNLKDESE